MWLASSLTASAGGAYKYNTTTGEVTDISPTGNGFGAVYSDPDDANRLIATTCGLWYSQLWYENAWEDENVCWGDRFFKSEDGGATWTSMTPGNQIGWGQPLEAEYLQSGGFDWIENKAIHWAGGDRTRSPGRQPALCHLRQWCFRLRQHMGYDASILFPPQWH